MDLEDSVWMVFVTWVFGLVDFDMGFDSAEYKGAGLYMYVCLVSMIIGVVLMHLDFWNGARGLFTRCGFSGTIPSCISITTHIYIYAKRLGCTGFEPMAP